MALLRTIFNNSGESDDDDHGIVPLTLGDLPDLRLHLHSRLHAQEAYHAIRMLPGLSQWHPKSGEYVLVLPWRHRSDVVSLREISAFYYEEELVSAVFDAADEQGYAACITAETYEKRRPVFYERNGMGLLETIIAYHHDRVEDFLDTPDATQQHFLPVVLENRDLLERVIATDHAAFSWLWRNAPGEFWNWMQHPAVEVWAGMIDGEVASYYGVTYFQQMGHLDRIAVHPKFQGRKLGRETLHHALKSMARRGLKTSALSTQLGNPVSQALYEHAGYHRSEKDDYHMYGTLLSAAPNEAEQE